jgi:NhaP-type Na+/H+ or K+/H+ antiporter
MAEEANTPDNLEVQSTEDSASHSLVEDRIETATVRRAPKYSVFLIAGAALGILVALILTFAFNGTDEPSVEGVVYSTGQVFAFLALIGIAVGIALGAIVALILDRTVGRRTRKVTVDRESIHVVD